MIDSELTIKELNQLKREAETEFLNVFEKQNQILNKFSKDTGVQINSVDIKYEILIRTQSGKKDQITYRAQFVKFHIEDLC